MPKPTDAAIRESVSFEAFKRLRDEFPDMPTCDLVKIWASRVNLAGNDYAFDMLEERKKQD